MVSVCFYFQVHQPFRLNKYKVFDIGNSQNYFDDEKNMQILNKVAEKCYLPANKLMLDLINRFPQFKFSFSLSGTVLEQFEAYNPEVLESFRRLVDTGKVEILNETYYHSLAFLFSFKEFRKQVIMHRQKIYKLFGKKTHIFRNTELIFNNDLARAAKQMGYKAVLAEGWDPVLNSKSPNFAYEVEGMPLLLKNYRLSDDIAFRFSCRDWCEYPLTAEKFASWINSCNGNGQVVNLFMDYETFGEHQWRETGIFDFLSDLPGEILKNKDNDFVTPSEAVSRYPIAGKLDVPYTVSWADTERDLSAWMGNKMQVAALNKLYSISPSSKLAETWRKLQSSDHFYYMCTKWFNDGDVHRYFNPYETPYDCYIAFMNILNDLSSRGEA